MKDFRSRKKNISLMQNPVVIFILFILLILLIRSSYESYQKKNRAKTEQEKFSQQYEDLVKKRERLIERIEYLKTEQGAKEELKKNHNLAEPGEKIIRIVESRN